jgi:transcriptional regulator with XRE-family HTH domain
VANIEYFISITAMRPNAEPLRILLSKNIKKYRNNFRYTQEKLAEKAGLSMQTLNDIEGGRRWVSSKTLTKLAKALNIEEYQLLLPENGETEKNQGKSSLQSLISLKDSVICNIDIQFERAMETGDFS